jgi:hypothetical protein
MSDMPDVPEEVREYFRELARKGKYPQKGGKARARKLTSEQRTAIAKQAAAARWKLKSEKSESPASTKKVKPKKTGK